MKKTILFILPLLILALFANGQGKATVNIHFTNVNADSCSIKFSEFYIDEYEPVFKSAIKNNACIISLSVKQAVPASVMYGSHKVPLYIEPAADLSLTINNDTLNKAVAF